MVVELLFVFQQVIAGLIVYHGQRTGPERLQDACVGSNTNDGRLIPLEQMLDACTLGIWQFCTGEQRYVTAIVEAPECTFLW